MQDTFMNAQGVRVCIPELLDGAQRYARRLLRGRSLQGLDGDDVAQCALLAALPHLEGIHTSPQAFVCQRALWCFLDLKRSEHVDALAMETLSDGDSGFQGSPLRLLEARRLLGRLQRELGSEALVELAALELELASGSSDGARDAYRYRLRNKARALRDPD